MSRIDRSPSVELGGLQGGSLQLSNFGENKLASGIQILDSIALVSVYWSIVNRANAAQCRSRWPAVSTNKPQKRQFSGR